MLCKPILVVCSYLMLLYNVKLHYVIMLSYAMFRYAILGFINYCYMQTFFSFIVPFVVFCHTFIYIILKNWLYKAYA